MKKRIFSFFLALVMVFGLVPVTALTASAATMTASEDCIDLIKNFEGFHATAYWDNGQWTIGYGTTSSQGATITREEADAAMREHVKKLETSINTFAGANGLTLTQAQFDALISFSFNCGTAWTAGSGKFRSAVLNKTTGNDFLYAICLWANVGTTPSAGLIKRRLCEANLYLNGRYSTTPPSNYTYVLLNANGGDVGEDKMQGYDTTKSVAVKAVPVNTGKTFAGWYTAKSGGTKVTALSSAHAGKTLYAMWGTAAKVTNSYVNVRNAAGTVGTSVVAKLNMGESIVIFETKTVNGSLWGRYDGGWVALMYTDYKAPSNKPADTETGTGTGTGTGSTEKVVATATVSCSTYVNVRNTAGTVGTTVVGKLANGAKVELYEIKVVNGHKWGRISNGWFCLDYAVLDSEGQTGTKPESGTGSTTQDQVLATGTVIGTYVNVRNAAGTVGTTVVGKLNKGDKVSIYEYQLVSGVKWGRIGKNRWVCLNYVTLDNQGSTGSGNNQSSVMGKIQVPAGTKLYNQYGEAIGTLNQTVKFDVKTLVVFQGSEVVYYEVTGGYVKAEGLVLTLTAAEAVVTAKLTKAYDAAGAQGNSRNVAKGTKVSITKLAIVGQTVWAYVTGTGGSGWIDAEDLEEDKTPAPGTGTVPDGGGVSSGNGQPIRTGTVTGSYVNVRNAAGTVGTTVVGKLNKGDKVSIYEIKSVSGHQWGRIGDNRWVCLDYVSMNAQTGGDNGGSSGNTGNGGNTGNTGNAGDNTGEKVIATGIVTSTTLNIRSGAGMGFGTVGSLSKNYVFSVYEIKLANDMVWGRIGASKWICLSYTLLDSTGPSTGRGEMGTIIKTGYAVNIRNTTSTGGALMGKIRVNGRVEILETKKVGSILWGRISLGWISMEYVMLDSQLPPGMTPDMLPGAGTGTGSGTGTTPPATNPGTGTNPNPGTTPAPGGNTGNGSTKALYTGKIILTNALKIRQNPTTTSAELATLARGASVTIYEVTASQNMAWGRCDKGWICLTYVDLVPASGNGAVDARVVQYDGLNVREGAGTKHKSVGTYSKAEVVDIYEFSGNWGRTDKGWVCLDYLLT